MMYLITKEIEAFATYTKLSELLGEVLLRTDGINCVWNVLICDLNARNAALCLHFQTTNAS